MLARFKKLSAPRHPVQAALDAVGTVAAWYRSEPERALAHGFTVFFLAIMIVAIV